MKKIFFMFFIAIMYTISLFAVSLTDYASVSWIAEDSNSPLFKAILDNDLNKVKQLISTGANVNEKAEKNITPLMLAVENSYYDIAIELLKRKADINATANFGNDEFGEGVINNVFLFAVNKNDIKMIQILADAGGNINMRHQDGTTPLLYATMLEARRGNRVSMIEKLIELGADVNAQDKDGATPISWIMHGAYEKKEVLKLLLAAGADVNAKDVPTKTTRRYGNFGSGFNFDYDGTPLLIASAHRDIETIDLLMAHGAKINATDRNGRNAILCTIWSPRHHIDNATIEEMAAVIKKLLSFKININASDILGHTAIHYACFEGNTKKNILPNTPLIKILLDSGADINAQDNDGKSALMLVAKEDKVDNVKYLLERGANPYIKDKNGKTALDLARENEAVDAFWALKPYYK